MEITTVVKASEREMITLLNKHFNINEEGFVALEELGNQEWVVDISPENNDLSDFLEYSKNGELGIQQYMASDALNKLCFDKVIMAGEYIIDCTW